MMDVVLVKLKGKGGGNFLVRHVSGRYLCNLPDRCLVKKLKHFFTSKISELVILFRTCEFLRIDFNDVLQSIKKIHVVHGIILQALRGMLLTRKIPLSLPLNLEN